MSSSEFWLQEPCILFTDFVILPNKSMTKAEQLNALTRLVILATIILYFVGYKHWLTFLIATLLIIIFLNYLPCNSKSSQNIENFTLTPTYFSVSNPNQTTVAPLFAEEWQIYPPAYDIQTEPIVDETFDDVLVPQQYPYGQYLTKTNLLPTDDFYVRQMDGGTTKAREYVNSSFTRNTLAHRDNMMRLYKKQIARRFRQNYNDTVSPYTSY